MTPNPAVLRSIVTDLRQLLEVARTPQKYSTKELERVATNAVVRLGHAAQHLHEVLEAEVRLKEMSAKTAQAEHLAVIRRAEAEAQQAALVAEQARIVAATRELEMERARGANLARAQAVEEIRRQNELRSYPIIIKLEALLTDAKSLVPEEIRGTETEAALLEVYLALQSTLEKTSTISLKARLEVATNTLRMLQVESILADYDEKLRRVREDLALPDDEREAKTAYWREMRDSFIAGLRNDVVPG